MNQIGNLAVAPECATVQAAVVPLTDLELKILRRLSLVPGQRVSVDSLHEAMYGHSAVAKESNVLQVLVGRLRKKLTAAGAGVAIDNVRGEGYALRAEPQAQPA
jgi:DNA-binding response OmpR family regulator